MAGKQKSMIVVLCIEYNLKISNTGKISQNLLNKLVHIDPKIY